MSDVMNLTSDGTQDNFGSLFPSMSGKIEIQGGRDRKI